MYLLCFTLLFLYDQALGLYQNECSDNFDCRFNTTSLRCSKIDNRCTCIRYHFYDVQEKRCILNNYALKMSLSLMEMKDEEQYLKGTIPVEIQGYHKHCTHDDQCEDFSLICSPVIGKCVCARFHDLINKKCIINYSSLKHWLASLDNEVDIKAELDEKAVAVFKGLAFSGILAIGLGLIGGLSCVFVFCVLKNVGHRIERKEGNKNVEEAADESNINNIETVSPLFLVPPVFSP